jgi:hypothetical protein
MIESNPSYDDLQLRIERGEGASYRVLASASDGRTARSTFETPITDDELDDFVRRVGLLRRRGRSDLQRMAAMESLGSKLFNSLIKDDVQSMYQAARGAAQEHDRGLRITLQLSDAAELMRLPWEFLYSRPRFLSQSTFTPVVRSLDLATRRRPLKVKLPLKILGMVSSPTDYEGLDADVEREKLEGALRPLTSERLVELQWLERATLAELSRKMAQPDEIHILHYIGHGSYDEANEEGILVLEDRRGRADDVPGATVGAMLQNKTSLRLVVLNSCEGARTSCIDPFSGVATKLIEFDIPAVIGMQFEITNEAAIAFSESLYSTLAHGLPVDAALGPARLAILAEREAEFGTPVLFLRAADARLFDLPSGPAQMPSTPPTPEPGDIHPDLSAADPQWTDALNAYWAQRWQEAVERLETLRARYPGEARVEEKLHQARRQRDIGAFSSKAEAAAAESDWNTVVTALENLTALDPAYPDVGARLEQARTAQRRKAMVDEMTALHQAGQWDAVLAAAQELARLDPDNSDPGGIVSDAKAKIRDAELADRYAQALNHLDQEDWQQAADLFAAIEQEQPGYREAATLLTTAQRQRDLAAWSDQATAAAAHDDWDTALTALEKICAVDPTYRDVGVRLEQTRSAKRLRALVDEVTALHQAGRWKEVVAAADDLARLDPDHPDPGGIVSDAQAKLREAAQRIADLQDKLREYAAAKNWQSVVEVNHELAALDPDVADPDGLVTRAREMLEAKPQRHGIPAQTPPNTQSIPHRSRTPHEWSQPRAGVGVRVAGVGDVGTHADPRARTLGVGQRKHGSRWRVTVVLAVGGLTLIAAVAVGILVTIGRGRSQLSSSSPSTAASSTFASTTAAPFRTRVLLGGKNVDVGSQVVSCQTSGDDVSITVGSAGISAELTKGDPPKVIKVSLGMAPTVDGVVFLVIPDESRARVTKSGNAYKITGTAIVSELSTGPGSQPTGDNTPTPTPAQPTPTPAQPPSYPMSTEPFEIDAICP